jgi:hypothetical protein
MEISRKEFRRRISRYSPWILLENEDEKKISRWFKGGQMLLHVAQSSTYTGLATGKLRGIYYHERTACCRENGISRDRKRGQKNSN